MNIKKYNVLIVQGSDSILRALQDYLISNFEVFLASSLEEAKKSVLHLNQQQQQLHFILTDISLKDGDALNLIKFTQEYFHNVKIAFLTAHNINNYVSLAYNENISQLILQHSSINLKFIEAMLLKTLTRDIFGIEKYFPDIKILFPADDSKQVSQLSNKVLYDITIKSPMMRYEWSDKIASLFYQTKSIPENFSKLIIDEISINAMIRAPRNEDGTYKFQTFIEDEDTLIPNNEIALSPNDYFILRYGYYNDWIIIICQDFYGALSKKEILYRLSRHIVIDDETGLPTGLPDSHGRGFFLLREHLTYLIINIQKNKKSEIICLYNTKQQVPYKDISIFEVE